MSWSSSLLCFAVLAACAPKATPPEAAGDPSGEAPADTVQLGSLAPKMESLGALGGGPPPPGARAEDVLVPVGVWVTTGADLVAFTYVDHEAGLSLRAEVPVPDDFAASAGVPSGTTTSLTLRLSWRSEAMRVLTEAERRERGLPNQPDWLVHYGPQPEAGTLWGTWRLDPRLVGRFHPEYPDDLEVLFDDRPPSKEGFELMWVRVDRCEPTRCGGRLLNAPFHLKDHAAGAEVWFGLDTSRPGAYLLMEGLDGPAVPFQR